MPAVSTGGTPLPAIRPSAATASRPTTSIDGRFEALLTPIAADLGKVGNKPVQPETLVVRDRPLEPTNQAPDQAKVAIRPVDCGVAGPPTNAGEGAKMQPAPVTTSVNQPGQRGGTVVPDLAPTP